MIASNGLELKFTTNGTVVGIEETRELYYYSYDVCDGRRETGSAMADHRISLTVSAEKEAVLKLSIRWKTRSRMQMSFSKR